MRLSFFHVALMALFAAGPARADDQGSLPDRVDVWMNSVVLLITGPGWCSGVVIDTEGTVATAYHCVASGLKSEIHTRDGRRFMGKMIAAEPINDLALVSVPELAGVVAPLKVREDAPRQGETVYGLGHPFAPFADRTPAMKGMLNWSITSGIVSAVGPRLIQTDAALNPGNSGGPVVDEAGRIIGITSRKLGGDNVAFLSHANNVRGLQESRKKPSIFGGTVGAGFSLYMPQGADAYPGFGLGIGSTIRDRVVVGAGFILDGQSESDAAQYGFVWKPAWEVNAGLKQTLGRGHFSTAVEVGAGFIGSQTMSRVSVDSASSTARVSTQRRVDHMFYGRFLVGGMGIRVVYIPDAPDSPAREGTALAGQPTMLLVFDFGLPTLATY